METGRTRRRKKRRRRLNLRGKFLLFFVELCVIFVLLRFSVLLEIKEIMVEGAIETDSSEIVELSKVKLGENLFSINRSDIRKKVLKNPMIKNVFVEKKYLDKLKIVVEEKVPAAKTAYNGKIFVINSELEVLASKNVKSKTIVLRGFLKKDPGGKLFSPEEEKEPTGVFLKKLLSTFSYKELKHASLLGDNISLGLTNGIGVFFGSSVNSEYKLELLKEILSDIEQKKIRVKMIDMTKGKYPVLILNEGESENEQ